MLQEFISQDYLIIEQNVVVNVVVWDGDTSKWTPPQGSIALIQAITPAMVWEYDKPNNIYVLTKVLGAGNIGFTWDGSVVTTNEPQPEPLVQPITKGTQPA